MSESDLLDAARYLFIVRPIEPPDHDRTCPKCNRSIQQYDDHETGCLNWGMLPEHWRRP